MRMRALNALCLFSFFSYSLSRVITIEDFGGKPDSQINIEKEPVHHPEFLHSSQKNNPSSYDLARIKHHRAKDKDDDLIQQAIENTNAYNLALDAANPGDRLLLYEHESYTFMGGIQAVDLHDVVLDFAGYTRFIYDLDDWPMRNYTGGSGDEIMEVEYVPALDLLDCSGMVITCSAVNKAIVSVDYETNEIYMDAESGSGGIIDGHGKRWWDSAILGDIVVESRPRLIDVRGCMNVTVEYITLVNSPYWTLTLEAIGAEVQYVNVLVDRNYQRQLINNTMVDNFMESESLNFRDKGDTVQEARQLRKGEPSLDFHFPDILPDWILQPQNLNTDGIDPIGQDIHIHDCIVLNDDDSIAVKPPRHGRRGSVMNGTIPYECTSNITIENMVLTGFGASVGSVGPTESHPCVDNVTFRNIKMPGTGKGIYIKSNKSDCKGNVSSRITNILYDNIYIKQPVWWPIWIGPQQQHEPHTSLGADCALDYPIGTTACPTQGCSTFENITIRNVVIEDPLLSPGVIMGNSTNPMKNIIFENVTTTVPYKYFLTHGRLPFHTKWFPFTGRFKCQHAQGTCKDCKPVPDGFEVIN